MEGNDPTLTITQPVEKTRKGRLPGAVGRYSKSSVARLRELGFDPIEKLVQLYEQIDNEITDLTRLKEAPILLKNGETRRYSSMAHASLLTTQQKLINDLMRYGYARVSETVNLKNNTPPGLTINLTPKDGVFNVDGVIDIDVDEDNEED